MTRFFFLLLSIVDAAKRALRFCRRLPAALRERLAGALHRFGGATARLAGGVRSRLRASISPVGLAFVVILLAGTGVLAYVLFVHGTAVFEPNQNRTTGSDKDLWARGNVESPTPLEGAAEPFPPDWPEDHSEPSTEAETAPTDTKPADDMPREPTDDTVEVVPPQPTDKIAVKEPSIQEPDTRVAGTPEMGEDKVPTPPTAEPEGAMRESGHPREETIPARQMATTDREAQSRDESGIGPSAESRPAKLTDQQPSPSPHEVPQPKLPSGTEESSAPAPERKPYHRPTKIPQDTPTAYAMFRGDAAHAGVYHSTPVRFLRTVLWTFQTEDRVESSPVVADKAVFFGSNDDHVYAVDAMTGRPRWQVRTGDDVRSSPAVMAGTVYVGSQDDYLYALDARTGKMKWQFETDGDINSSPTLAHGMVYIGSNDKHLYAIDAATGRERWRAKFPEEVEASPTVAQRLVYVGDTDGCFQAVDAFTGSLRWRFNAEDDILASATVAGNIVYVGDEKGNLYALDAATGRAHGCFKASDDFRSSPACANGVLYAGSNDNHLYAIEAQTGRPLWRFRAQDDIRSSPAVAGDMVFVGSEDDYVYALDAKDGVLKWRFRTGKDIHSSPALANGILYIGSQDGKLYALAGENPVVAPGREQTPTYARTQTDQVRTRRPRLSETTNRGRFHNWRVTLCGDR